MRAHTPSLYRGRQRHYTFYAVAQQRAGTELEAKTVMQQEAEGTHLLLYTSWCTAGGFGRLVLQFVVVCVQAELSLAGTCALRCCFTDAACRSCVEWVSRAVTAAVRLLNAKASYTNRPQKESGTLAAVIFRSQPEYCSNW